MIDPTDVESALERLNANLDLPSPPVQGSRPVLLVVGPPRCGSTAAMQFLVRHHPLAYPSNLVARFWQAPWLGAAVQRSLVGDLPRPSGDPRNAVGATTGWLEPHEFGRFWSRRLGYPYGAGQMRTATAPDVERTRHELAVLATSLGGPVAMKGFHPLPFLADLMGGIPELILLRVERSREEVVSSLAALRTADARYRAGAGPVVRGSALPDDALSVLEQSRVQVDEIELLLDDVAELVGDRMATVRQAELEQDIRALRPWLATKGVRS